MPSPFAVALAALLALSGAGYSQTTPVAQDATIATPAAGPVFIILRPEASDIYISPRTRIGGEEIIIRNPDLIRANQEGVPYRLEDAAAQGWQHVRHSDLPVMRALSSLQASVVPEPGSAFLLAFSSLIFLRRRRANPFGGEHSQHMQDCSLPAGGGVNQETP